MRHVTTRPFHVIPLASVHESSQRRYADAGASPMISVIIPAFNEARFIRRCLSSVLSQNYPADKLEIIVIDNDSTDETAAIAVEMGARVYVESNLSVGGLRNFAAAHASGEVLAFIDSDCEAADPHWLRHGVESLNTEPCITGNTYAVPEPAHWIEQAWFAAEPDGRRRTTHINAGNLFVRAELYNALGGFDATLASGEDYEFAQRASHRVRVIADDRIRVIHHGNPKSLQRFLQREIWHGLGALASVKHDWLDLPFWGSLTFMVASIGQLVGLLAGFLGFGWHLLAMASGTLALLLLATVEYRMRFGFRFFIRLQLLGLYYLFYLGRSVALVRMMFTARRYRRLK